MVKEYLEELYQEIYSEKISLEQKIQKKKMDLSDNIKYVDTLRKSLDKDFESFSPNNVDQKKYDEINILTEEQEKIRESISCFENRIAFLDIKIKKINYIIEYFRVNQGYTDVPSKSSENYLDEEENDISNGDQSYVEIIKNSVLPNLSQLCYKIDTCSKLVSIDSIRCKLELNEIDKCLKNIIQQLDELE